MRFVGAGDEKGNPLWTPFDASRSPVCHGQPIGSAKQKCAPTLWYHGREVEAMLGISQASCFKFR
jgi:hypothetical protein